MFSLLLLDDDSNDINFRGSNKMVVMLLNRFRLLLLKVGGDGLWWIFRRRKQGTELCHSIISFTWMQMAFDFINISCEMESFAYLLKQNSFFYSSQLLKKSHHLTLGIINEILNYVKRRTALGIIISVCCLGCSYSKMVMDNYNSYGYANILNKFETNKNQWYTPLFFLNLFFITSSKP